MTTVSARTASAVRSVGWDERLRRITLVIGRLGLALLFFTQLFWKLPPTFGCGEPGQFAFTTEDANGQITRGSGLCDWLGIESIFAQRDRAFLETAGPAGRLFAVPVGLPVQINGAIVDNVVIPGIGFFGWLVWLAEFLIVITMLFGMFTRLGALVSILIGLQLMFGLAGAWDPAADIQEWEWSYHQIVLLSIILLGAAPGRYWGVDGWLRPRLKTAAERGNRVAGVLYSLT